MNKILTVSAKNADNRLTPHDDDVVYVHEAKTLEQYLYDKMILYICRSIRTKSFYDINAYNLDDYNVLASSGNRYLAISIQRSLSELISENGWASGSEVDFISQPNTVGDTYSMALYVIARRYADERVVDELNELTKAMVFDRMGVKQYD